MKERSVVPPGCADLPTLVNSLSRDVGCVATQRAVSYDISYPEFLRYFRDAGELTRHHVIIAANFAYGWMPTVLKSISTDLDAATQSLQRARDGQLLRQAEIENLANVINGSSVGASKVLHFAAPSNYAIWDSRVATYLGAMVQRGSAGASQYIAYNESCRAIASRREAENIRSAVGEIIKCDISAIRALELVMYCGALEKRTYAGSAQ